MDTRRPMMPLPSPVTTWDRDGLKITRRFHCTAAGILEKELLEERVYDYFPLKDGATYVDVGASIGIWTCDVSSRVSDSVIYSIEPHPETYMNLLVNIGDNRHSNRIIPLEVALYGEDAPLSLQVSYVQHNASIYGDFKNPHSTRAVTWDTFTDENGIDEVYLMKIDTEGAEYPILQGMTKCLPQHIILSAYHVDHYRSEDTKTLIERLEEMDYRVEYQSPDPDRIVFATRNTRHTSATSSFDSPG